MRSSFFVEALPGSLRTRRWDISPRVSLTAFVLFVCGAIVTMFVADTLHDRGLAEGVALLSTRNIAASIADQTSDTFEAVDGALVSIADRIETDGTGSAARLRLRDAMAGLVATMPRIHAIDFVDAHGRFMVSNLWATPDFNPPAADRPYFRYHRLHPESSVYISGPARSRVDGAWVIFMTRRLDGPDGRFAGVLIAPVSMSYFDQMFASVDVGRHGSIALFADDTTLMARQPRVRLGQRVAHVVLFSDAYKYQASGTYISQSTVDQTLRLFAFRRLGRYPFVIDVALAQSEYLADWRQRTIYRAIVLGSLIAMIAGLAAGLGAQINRSKRAEENLARLALIDGLTGLANRRQFDAVLEREWRTAVRERTSLALLMLDVDHFKAYNDLYGHLAGDDVLTSIARTIDLNIVRPRDVAARYGGEEFAVILPGTDVASALVVAERIRGAILALAVPHAGTAGLVASVSIGAASLAPTSLTERARLIRTADRALYDAKRAGRNRTSAGIETSEVAPGPADTVPLDRPC